MKNSSHLDVSAAPAAPAERQTFQARRQEFDAAIVWAQGIAKVPASSRFARYQKFLAKLSDAADAHTVEELLGQETEFDLFTALHESHSLTEIHNGFRSYDKSDLQLLLKKVIGGQFSYQEESGSGTHGRDTAFELVLASKLIQAGYDVLVGGDCDIVIRKGAVKYFIECKRPKNEKSANRLVGEAIGQLRCRIDAVDGQAFGFFALSLDLVLNQQFRKLGVPTQEDIPRAMAGQISGYFADNGLSWNKFYDRGIAGGLMTFSTPLVVEEPSMFFYASQTLPFMFRSDSAGATRAIVSLNNAINLGSEVVTYDPKGVALLVLSNFIERPRLGEPPDDFIYKRLPPAQG